MKDYHAADHEPYVRDLQRHVGTAERGNVMYRPPDFALFPTYTEIRRRRDKVCAFVIGVALPIAIGFFAALIFLPL